GERCFFLDVVLTVACDGPRDLENLSRLADFDFALARPRPIDPSVQRAFKEVDWDRALRGVNRMFDRMAAAMRREDRRERETRLDRISDELKKLKAKLSSVQGLAKLLSGPEQTAETRGALLGDFLVSRAGVLRLPYAWDRSEQRRRNLHLAFALATYLRDHG